MRDGYLARIVRNLGASAMSQVITLVIQLVSVPVFLSSWGVPLYGEWLTLNAICTFFVLSDLG
ncbi:MAG: hypothetical protein V1754_08555, partial [Pseudomonadota bacterium]